MMHGDWFDMGKPFVPGGAIGVDEKLFLPQRTSKADSARFCQFGQSMLRVYMHCLVRRQKFETRGKVEGVPAILATM